MTERERLIELINNGTDGYRIAPIINGVRDSLAEYTADYLLANGVIVPPCMVGDTVYYLTSVDTEDELNVTEIFCGTVTSISSDRTGVWVSAKYKNGLYYCHKSKDFGKTVFLTKEDAEKALKERSGGNEHLLVP